MIRRLTCSNWNSHPLLRSLFRLLSCTGSSSGGGGAGLFFSSPNLFGLITDAPAATTLLVGTELKYNHV